MARTPGVYREEVLLPPPKTLVTGVPAFLAGAANGPVAVADAFALWPRLADLLRQPGPVAGDEAQLLDRLRGKARLAAWTGGEAAIRDEPWRAFGDALRVDSPAAFARRFAGSAPDGYLADAVTGFFQNGGHVCYVLRLDPDVQPFEAHRRALLALELLEDVDLVCAPDTSSQLDAVVLQQAVLEHCDRSGTRLAILDSVPGGDVLAQRAGLVGTNGALYYPWLRTSAGRLVPPCGHVAGVVARTDARVGVHKAPANEPVEGVLDVEVAVAASDQATLNERGVNALRAFPGRGIRVWGARTLSDSPAWRYVNVRRIFLTAARWIEVTMAETLFEPSSPALWARVRLRLTQYFTEQFRRGALMGASPADAFYVRCDDETNPPEVRDGGGVVAEVGLAPAFPHEFVVVHIVRDARGVAVTGPVPA
jgi:Bacteriophage tail sheath protein